MADEKQNPNGLPVSQFIEEVISAANWLIELANTCKQIGGGGGASSGGYAFDDNADFDDNATWDDLITT